MTDSFHRDLDTALTKARQYMFGRYLAAIWADLVDPAAAWARKTAGDDDE